MSEEKDVTAQRMSIPGDAVKQAVDRLLETGEINEDGKREILWLYGYAMDRNFNLDDVGKVIKRDATTAHRLFHGRYGAKYDNIIADIKRFHALADARGSRVSLGFVETSVWKKIDQVCRHALVAQKTVFIFGRTQIGKTKALEEFARRNNHGQTKYVRMPAAPTLGTVMQEIAASCYISSNISLHATRKRIFEAIDEQMLLIIDEAHQALISGTESKQASIMEYLREIYDRCRCGIVLCGTNVFRDELENGRVSRVLEQLKGRGIITLQLPSYPPKSDIITIAKKFGLTPPEGDAQDIIQGMVKKTGLSQYVTFLQQASNLAANQKKTLTWDHFVGAYDIIQSLSATN